MWLRKTAVLPGDSTAALRLAVPPVSVFRSPYCGELFSMTCDHRLLTWKKPE